MNAAQQKNISWLNVAMLFLLVMSGGGILFVFYSDVCLLLLSFMLAFAFIVNTPSLRISRVVYVFAVAIGLSALLMLNYVFAPFGSDALIYLRYIVKINIIAAFLLYYRESESNFTGELMLALVVVMVHALINFILGFFVWDLVTKITTDYYSVYTFLHVFFYQISEAKIFDISIGRNQGLFWEPGILQIYMNIAFYLASHVRPSRMIRLLAALVFCNPAVTFAH